MKRIFIKTEFITLGQFLKFSGIISNGSEAKEFLNSANVLVDGIRENRRGKKLYPNTKIVFDNETYIIENGKGE